jgi:hypothetical protein
MAKVKLKLGDKVKIAKTSEYYEEDRPSNPRNIAGTIIERNKGHVWIRVKWSNGEENSYREYDLVLFNEDSTELVVFARREFVLEAYKGACSEWKAKIAAEVPNLYDDEIPVKESFIRLAYKAADTIWKAKIRSNFPELYKDVECTSIVPKDVENVNRINAKLYTYDLRASKYVELDGIELLTIAAGKDSVPEEAAGCGIYVCDRLVKSSDIVVSHASDISTGVTAIYFKTKQ